MIMKLNINDRAALAIKNNTKRAEIRANKENSKHDYSKLKQNDIIEFNSNNLGVFYVKVKEVKVIGNMLMNKMEDYFKSEGCEYILVDVFAYNDNAIKFYDKNGYHSRMYTNIKKIG